MLRRSVYFIFSAMILSSVFAEASTAPKCSAVLLFQKSEVKAQVTAIAKTIATHQMKLDQGLQGDQYAFSEATRQINEITQNYPEMVEFYMAELKRVSQNGSKLKKEVKTKVQKEEQLKNRLVNLENSVIVIEFNNDSHFIFKNKDGTYFIASKSNEFANFFYNQKEIQQILTNQSNNAVAILKKDGTVVTWGDPENGGYSSNIKLTDVQSIYSTGYAFAALKKDGSVVTWGNKQYGGDSSNLDLTNVNSIYSNGTTFIAIKNDDSSVVWGETVFRDDFIVDLKNTNTIFSTWYSFAVLKNDGSAVSWGHKTYAGSSLHTNLSNVRTIHSTKNAFAATLNDGTIFTWGPKSYGGNSSNVDLQKVHSIFTTDNAFAALKHDGTVVSWGDQDSGGDSSKVDLTNVKSVFSTGFAFAALKNDGSVVAWGMEIAGGDSSAVQKHLYDITQIIEVKSGSFLAQRKDGKYVLWGMPIGDFKNQVIDFDLF